MHKLLAKSFLITGFLLCVFVAFSCPAMAENESGQLDPAPQFPAIYYGTVMDKDSQAISTGIIKAYVEDELCGELPFSAGQYGMPADDANVKRLLVYSAEDLTDKEVTFKVFIDNRAYPAITEPESVIWKSKDKIQVNLIIEKPSDSLNPYWDMQGHWAGEVVRELVNKGIISGYEDSSFRPDNFITRTECAAIVARALSMPPGDVDQLNEFADCNDIPAWSRGNIAAVTEAGYINGYLSADNSKTFLPNKPVTRIELAVILSRLLTSEEQTQQVTVQSFTDQEKIPVWAREEVVIAVQNGLVSGYPDGTFQPQQNVTRAEAASMISRMLDNK